MVEKGELDKRQDPGKRRCGDGEVTGNSCGEAVAQGEMSQGKGPRADWTLDSTLERTSRPPWRLERPGDQALCSLASEVH